jgi:ABC-type ATPase involved in cell division
MEGHMLRKLLLLSAAVVLMGGALFADSGERKDLQVFNDVSRTVNRYTQFTVFDDVDIVVNDGIVTLTGDVTMPHKRDDIEKRVARVDGVLQVRNQIRVLPASSSDDRLRYRIARAIYDNPHF